MSFVTKTRPGHACASRPQASQSVVCGLLLLSMGQNAQARAVDAQAQDILKKMNAVYTLAAYEGTATLNLKGAGEDSRPFSVSGTQEVVYKSPNLFYIKATGTALGGTQIRAFDGKDNIFYDSTRNRYIKQPLPTVALPPLSLFGVAVDPQSGRLAGSTVVGGHAAYLVQATQPLPPLRPDATPEEKAGQETLRKTMQPFELAIDKKTYRLLRVSQSAANKMTRTLEFTQQTFNPTLADNAFAFAPPPGARAMGLGANSPNGMARLPQPPPSGAVEKAARGVSPFPPPHASPAASGTSAHR